MRVLALCLATALLPLVQDDSTEVEAIVFERTDVRVGDWRTVDGKASVQLSIDVYHQGALVTTARQYDLSMTELRKTVRARDEERVTELLVEVGESSKTHTDQDGEVKADDPLAGVTFLARWEDGAVVVTDEDGEALGEELAAAALKLVKGDLDAGEDRFEDLFCGRALERDERIDVDSDVLARILFTGESPFDEMEFGLVFRGLEERDEELCGIFDVTLETSGTAPGDLEMSLEAKGEVVARYPQGWMLSMTLEGELEAQGTTSRGGAELELRGSGPMRTEKTYTYGHDE